MNYYDEILEKIEGLLAEEKYSVAAEMINDELHAPYVPREIEKRLIELKKRIVLHPESKNMSDEEITYNLFHGDSDHQLLAVSELNDKNLRNYIDLCSAYLKGDGFINAKVLLIDSLIHQEINHQFLCAKDGNDHLFNPSELTVIEESVSYKTEISLLEEDFLKEPSKLLMAKQLLYKEFILHLPEAYSETEAFELAKKIFNFINDAFGSANEVL